MGMTIFITMLIMFAIFGLIYALCIQGKQPGVQTMRPPVRFCQRCGKQDLSGGIYCCYCGNVLVPPVPAQNTAVPQQNFFANLWYQNKTAFIALYVVVTIFVGVIAGVIVDQNTSGRSGSYSSGNSYYGSDYNSGGDYYNGGSDYYNNGSSYGYDDACYKCGGTGICPVCNGLGGMSVNTYGQTDGVNWVVCQGCYGNRTCPQCNGTGRR